MAGDGGRARNANSSKRITTMQLIAKNIIPENESALELFVTRPDNMFSIIYLLILVLSAERAILWSWSSTTSMVANPKQCP
ncbi:hypothetical protein TFLX_01588 [Thermoflexales bacterium]|nr:hypothetical protein TFLX_01588 [Thermoflexales bacterium]